MTYASPGEEDDESDNDDSVDTNSSAAAAANTRRNTKKGNTAQLIESMANESSIKTYVALVRGEGILHGEDLKQRGWFEVNRKIKDENGNELKDATTLFNFVAGQAEEGLDRPRISLVLARPKQGRWHQIRVSRKLSLLFLVHLDDINFTHRFPYSCYNISY